MSDSHLTQLLKPLTYTLTGIVLSCPVIVGITCVAFVMPPGPSDVVIPYQELSLLEQAEVVALRVLWITLPIIFGGIGYWLARREHPSA